MNESDLIVHPAQQSEPPIIIPAHEHVEHKWEKHLEDFQQEINSRLDAIDSRLTDIALQTQREAETTSDVTGDTASDIVEVPVDTIEPPEEEKPNKKRKMGRRR